MKHHNLVVVPELYTALLVGLNSGTGIGMVELPADVEVHRIPHCSRKVPESPLWRGALRVRG